MTYGMAGIQLAGAILLVGLFSLKKIPLRWETTESQGGDSCSFGEKKAKTV